MAGKIFEEIFLWKDKLFKKTNTTTYFTEMFIFSIYTLPITLNQMDRTHISMFNLYIFDSRLVHFGLLLGKTVNFTLPQFTQL